MESFGGADSDLLVGGAYIYGARRKIQETYNYRALNLEKENRKNTKKNPKILKHPSSIWEPHTDRYLRGLISNLWTLNRFLYEFFFFYFSRLKLFS